jgi:hypothetical protein
MEDSVYIFFFDVPDAARVEPLFQRLQEREPGLLLKHRPLPDRPLRYSVQAVSPGARFWDSDLDALYALVREAGGVLQESRIFYADEDFE